MFLSEQIKRKVQAYEFGMERTGFGAIVLGDHEWAVLAEELRRPPADVPDALFGFQLLVVHGFPGWTIGTSAGLTFSGANRR